LAVWLFAAVLVLPPALAVAVLIVMQGYGYIRVWHEVRVPLYRSAFSAATVVLAMHAAARCLLLHPYLSRRTDRPARAGRHARRSGLYWAINYGLVAAAILISTPTMTPTICSPPPPKLVIEIGAIGLGMAAAVVVVHQPTVLIGMVAGLLALHRSVLVDNSSAPPAPMQKPASIPHLLAPNSPNTSSTAPGCAHNARRPDDRPRPLQEGQRHLRPPAGDQVLAAVAAEVKAQVRELDTAARFGGEELVVVLPAISATDLQAVANASAGTSKSSPSPSPPPATAQPSSTTSPPPSAPRSTRPRRHPRRTPPRRRHRPVQGQNAGRNRVELAPLP